ncbi:MAG: sulfatase [Planctomycetes bacterium]|nr:sulfatase [Planctomycetota bacterium]
MNAIIISLGGLNAESVGCYGNGGIQTPHLDRLAAEGFVLDQAFADSPDPMAARRAWWTARHQFPLSRAEAGADLAAGEVPCQEQSLLGLLRSNGIRTNLIRDMPGIRSSDVPEEGDFERIIELEPHPPDSTGRAFETARQWLEHEAGNGPSLVFLDCCGVHGPAGLGAGEAQTVEALDTQLGSFLDGLQARGVWEGSLMLVTSDFGESVGLRDASDAVSGLHEERVHVPLILRWPGQTDPASRSPALVQAVDLMPTLLDAFGVAVPPSVQGLSLLPLVRFEQRKLREHACMGIAGRGWAIRTAQWHLIFPQPDPHGDGSSEPRLYVKPDDRWERNDVAKQFPDVAEQLLKTLHSYAG